MSGETIELKASPKKRRKGGGRKLIYTDEFTAPFPFPGMDSDNGSELSIPRCLNGAAMNASNSQGHVRLSTAAELGALAALYRPLCPLINFFIPSEKLTSKTRVGSKIRKVYDKQVLSPYRRLLACPDVTDEVKARLVKGSEMYNPVVLRRKVHDCGWRFGLA